jgi:dipeptidase D
LTNWAGKLAVSKPAGYPSQPGPLWEHFYQLTQIPRPSGEEAAVRDYIVELAEQANLQWQQDAAGNLVVYLPGSAGREQESPVVIQNHLDMVTVKTADKQHDFSTDPLTLLVEDGWLLADRTTLGADNGLGCAAALALITDTSLVHPPLEVLFTVEEETGLYGATDLDASLLQGRRMLNLDTEDWGELFIGCAGGRGWILRRPMATQAAVDNSEFWCLTLRGLAGGHSGIQIHQQLGNAIKLLGQWLAEAQELGLRLAGFEGGVAHNVIPREASLVFCCAPAQEQTLRTLNEQMTARWQSYLTEADAGLELQLESAAPAPVVTPTEQDTFIQLLLVFPHGAISYNREQPADLVDLSINLALVRLDADGLCLETTLRYFNSEEALALEQQVKALARWLQAEVETTIDYPGWQPYFESPLLAQTAAVSEQLFGRKAAIKAIHAGLECGIIKSKKEEMDVVSFGPTIRGAHSPRERLEIATVAPFWQLLTTLLSRL